MTCPCMEAGKNRKFTHTAIVGHVSAPGHPGGFAVCGNHKPNYINSVHGFKFTPLPKKTGGAK